jgi:outer membrane protein OmpA-like peptidoglycan-associated protein
MKNYLLTATTLSVLALSGAAFAQDNAKELSTQKRTVAQERAYDYEFNRDEQCQGYEAGIKGLGYEDTCKKKEQVEEVVVVPTPEVDVLKEYVVYFDFDDAAIRDADMEVLREAANAITTYNPNDVLVAGYTDTRGTNEYNDALSAKRANAVSTQLRTLGVVNSVVDEKALGESQLAVPTADSVKEQKNRRVVVQFIN